MAKGYRGVNARVVLHGTTIGVVTGMEMAPSKEGGLEHVYGTDTPVHIIGGDRARFRATRMYMSEDSDTDLFYDLFHNETHFNMVGDLVVSGVAVSNSALTLSNCVAYSYNPVFGGPNEVIGEEISGEASSWSSAL